MSYKKIALDRKIIFGSFKEASEFAQSLAKDRVKHKLTRDGDNSMAVYFEIIQTAPLSKDNKTNNALLHKNNTKRPYLTINKPPYKTKTKKNSFKSKITPIVNKSDSKASYSYNIRRKDISAHKEWFEAAESTLLNLVANIMQTTQKDSSQMANIVIAKTAGVASASGVLGLIGTFGTASTGTAIGTLSGAAASNATLFWLGSIVGGGVFAGTVLTGGIGIVFGYFALKWWKGDPRNPDDLTDLEKIILAASLGLIKAFHEQVGSGLSLTEEEVKFIKEKALSPLLTSVENYHKEEAKKNLNTKNYHLLGSRVREIRKLLTELKEWK